MSCRGGAATARGPPMDEVGRLRVAVTHLTVHREMWGGMGGPARGLPADAPRGRIVA